MRKYFEKLSRLTPKRDNRGPNEGKLPTAEKAKVLVADDGVAVKILELAAPAVVGVVPQLQVLCLECPYWPPFWG